MDPINEMLEELFPDASLTYRMTALWACSSFPFYGKDAKGVKTYREQIEECIRARPDDPIGYASETVDVIMAEIDENQVKEEQETQDDSHQWE